MNILLTSCDNPYHKQVGGKHIHQLLFEKGLKESGHQVQTVYPVFPTRNKFSKAFHLTCHLLPLNAYGVLQYRLFFDSRKIFKEELKSVSGSFDILHAQDPLSLMNTLSVKCHKRILTLHGYFTKENINYSGISGRYVKIFSKSGMEMERNAYNLADFIFCVDSSIKEYLIKTFNLPEEKIEVVFNAIDTEKFSPPSAKEIKTIRENYGYDENQFIILVPRRLVKKNGVRFAVEALKEYRDKDLLLLIAGDGPERKTIEKVCEGDNRVQFLGSVNHDKVIDYFKIADCILIPSITSSGFQEATSLAMLEGMCMCKPTICSAIGGMREVIRHNETGFLVEEQNPEAIAIQFEWIRNNSDLVSQITKNATDYILKNHHYLSHTKKIANFY